MTRPLEQQYTQKQAADILGVGLSTIRRWISHGELRAYRIGPRVIRIDAADLRQFREQVAPATFEYVNSGSR